MTDDAIDRARRLVALDCATCGCDWSGEACREPLSRDDVRALLAALDTARRAALEEAIAVCEDALLAHVHNEIAYRRDERQGLRVARLVVDGVLRALIDTPRTDPVRPAPVSASEER